MEEKTIVRDEILRATVFSSEAVVYLARTTELCEKARETHHASPLAAAVLGRTLTMTAKEASEHGRIRYRSTPRPATPVQEH